MTVLVNPPVAGKSCLKSSCVTVYDIAVIDNG